MTYPYIIEEYTTVTFATFSTGFTNSGYPQYVYQPIESEMKVYQISATQTVTYINNQEV